jgi:hypothetical protein
MEKSEVGELLILAAAYEHRPAPVEGDVEAWHLIIGYYDADLARECLLEHYAEETRRLWPADIVRRADEKIENDARWSREWWRRHPPADPEQQLSPAAIDVIMGRQPDGELPRGR